MVGIRADGNNRIGIGHVMRCLTIAQALRELGEEVLFILADSSCEKMVRERGFACYILGTEYDCMEGEMEALIGLTEELHIKALLIDSYYVTPKYLSNLREYVVTAYLDDVDSFPYPVDILINYNVFAKASDYPYARGYRWLPGGEDKVCSEKSPFDKEGETIVLAGPSFAPVRQEFSKHRCVGKKVVKDIFISLGGSDEFHLSRKIATMLSGKTECKIHVVCGPFNRDKEALRALALKEPHIVIHEDVKEMWKLMEQCDMAISAAGSTMCELAVAGLPAVTFSFVDNQRKIAKAFGAKNAALYVGHYIKDDEKEFLKLIAEEALQLVEDTNLRAQIAQNAEILVDGEGAGRIARVICEFMK